MNNDLSDNLVEQITQAYGEKTPLVITSGGSKSFYGNVVEGTALDVKQHSGIIEYRPSELVITARSGTKLSDIENELSINNQMLAFEPPSHTSSSTLGGSIACGLSGPRRPFAGAARDFVLGTTIINGNGQLLKFGGQVMKNVAGYDASRLMAGAQGTLGVLLDISVKVLPKPESELTLSFDKPFDKAHKILRSWIISGQPISASCYYEKRLFIRLSSTANSIKHSHQTIGGDIQSDNNSGELWKQLQHQNHKFFKHNGEDPGHVWRVSVPPATPAIATEYPQLTEWNGALRWISSNENMFELAKKYNGHATRYTLNATYDDNQDKKIFQELTSPMLALHQRIKKSFDPGNILNPGRLYKEL
jgi:glycolate oxidase FAD binding subunit